MDLIFIPFPHILSQEDIQTLRELDDWDRDSFWSSYHDFFDKRGYTLYKLITYTDYDHDDYYKPVYEPVAAESHIHALFSRRDPGDVKTSIPTVRLISLIQTLSTMLSVQRHIMYAQNKNKHDVVIKLVEMDSVEHQIHVHLLDCPEFDRPESFPFIIPTIEILPSPHNFCFVIMPR